MTRSAGRQIACRARSGPAVPAATTAALDAAYALIPAIECRGACADTCTRFHTTLPERRRLAAATGVPFPEYRDGDRDRGPLPTCPLLTWAGQCAAYAIRPLLCRLWGVSEIFPCNYGCRPVDGVLLGVRETYLLIAEVYDIAGERARATELRQILDIPDERIAAQMPILKAMAWGHLTYDQARRRLIAKGAF